MPQLYKQFYILWKQNKTWEHCFVYSLSSGYHVKSCYCWSLDNFSVCLTQNLPKWTVWYLSRQPELETNNQDRENTLWSQCFYDYRNNEALIEGKYKVDTVNLHLRKSADNLSFFLVCIFSFNVLCLNNSFTYIYVYTQTHICIVWIWIICAMVVFTCQHHVLPIKLSTLPKNSWSSILHLSDKYHHNFYYMTGYGSLPHWPLLHIKYLKTNKRTKTSGDVAIFKRLNIHNYIFPHIYFVTVFF